MVVYLVAGLVDGFDRGAGQFQRATRLETDVSETLGQADNLAFFLDWCPIELVAQAFQHRLYRPLAFVWQRLMRVFAVAKFLMLGADTPIFFGFTPVSQQLC